MRPNTSVRQPIIAAARRRPLADLLRVWRSQPRKRSPGLFWSLVALAVLLNADLLVLSVYLFRTVETEPASLTSNRRMLVPYSRNAALWEPLRQGAIRVDGQPRLFESFCRDAVRRITGAERFEDHDPLAVVFAWMLHREAGWGDYPFLRCEGDELNSLLSREVPALLRSAFIEPNVLRRSKSFRKLLRGVAVKSKSGLAAQLSPLERQAIELRDRLALFDRIHDEGIDAGQGSEIEMSRGALSEAYHSGVPDLFAAALTDYLDASRRSMRVDEDAAAVRRLQCQSWLNAHHPFRQARYFSLFAVALLTIALLLRSRPLARRGFLASGLLACLGCLAWVGAGLCCRAIVHGAAVSDGRGMVLWPAALAMGLGLVLALRGRSGFIALAGAMTSAVGFILAERRPALLDTSWPAGDAWSNVYLLTAVSAYAALALAWSVALLTLGRLVLVPPSGARLRNLAALGGRLIGIATALLIAGAIVAAFHGGGAGFGRGGEIHGMGTLLALPCCLALLYARRVGWIQSFGLLIGLALSLTAILAMWYVVRPTGAWRHRSVLDITANPWIYWAVLMNLSLAVHAVLRYYFGRQTV